MDAFAEEILFRSLPWAVVGYFLRRSLIQFDKSLAELERRIERGEIHGEELNKVMAKMNTKLEVIAVVVRVGKKPPC